ncbi:MAG: cell envelope integrity protein TolA [Verrucomicrobiota bacterium]
MAAVSSSAWAKSITLHGAIVGIMLLLAYASALNVEKPPKIMELVAGAGDDFGAKEAPAFGSESSVKLNVPMPPAMPIPAPPTPVPTPPRIVEPAPVTPPAPPVKKETPKAEPKKEETVPDFAKDIKKKVVRAEAKAKADVAKLRKKEEVERKKQEQISKAEFDKQKAKKIAANNSKTAPTSTKYKPVDLPKGVSGGVSGGSVNSQKGAQGTALTREMGTAMEEYYAELFLRLRRAYDEDPPPGLSDTLKATIEVRSNADGSLSQARIAVSSGSPEFDQAVLSAVKRVRMGPRPDKKGETMSVVFSMKE